MKRDVKEIIKELEKRGIKEISKQDLSSWALVFALEDIAKEMKNPFMVKGLEVKG